MYPRRFHKSLTFFSSGRNISRPTNSGADDDPEAANQIIEACARLPLALGIAVGRAAGRPKRSLAEVAAEIREARGGLGALEADDVATDVRAVFSWSYRHLPGDAALLFRRLGLHPGQDWDTCAAAALAGADSVAAASRVTPPPAG